MDVEALRRRVPTAELVSAISSRPSELFRANTIRHRLALYPSTLILLVDGCLALALPLGHKYFLPRVFCYFDDTVGDDDQNVQKEFVGELRAIREFNESSTNVKVAQMKVWRTSARSERNGTTSSTPPILRTPGLRGRTVGSRPDSADPTASFIPPATTTNSLIEHVTTTFATYSSAAVSDCRSACTSRPAALDLRRSRLLFRP